MMGKPLILLLSYYGCDGTCPTMNAELAKVLEKVDAFQARQGLPGADGVLRQAGYAGHGKGVSSPSAAGVPEAMRDGWRHAVLQGGDVQGFAGEVGFRFFWSDAAKAFLHPNVLVFLTPEGRVARYIYGTRMDVRTIELAITDADWERISNSTAVFDIFTGACFSYNYAEGRYQWNYSLLAGVGSLLLGLVSMGTGAWIYRRRMSRGRATELKEAKGRQGMHKQHVKGKMCRASAAVCGAVLAASSWAAETAQSAAPKINDPARGWDSLWHEVIVDITIIGILFAVVTAWFVFTSRRTAGNQTGASPKLSAGIRRRLDGPAHLHLPLHRPLHRRPTAGCCGTITATSPPTASKSSWNPGCTAGITPTPTACAPRTS
jgi:protein SCO1/2